MSLAIHLKHNIGNDPIFSKWRKTFYSNHPPVTVHSDLGEPLADFCFNQDTENGITFKTLLTPGSYFSPALLNYENWTEIQWANFLRRLSKTKNWDLCRMMMLNESAMVRLQKFCKQSGFPFLLSDYRFRMIPGHLSFADYLKHRSSKFNANQRRCGRHFDIQGFSFTHDLTFDEIRQVYQNRNIKKGNEDYAVTESFLNMLENIRRDFQAEHRWYEAGVRAPNGTLVAFVHGPWDTDKTFYLFQTGHDPQYHSLRLGALVFDYLIEDILTLGCSNLSFMSDSEYLDQFSKWTFPFRRIDIHNRTPKGLLSFGRNSLGRVRDTLKEYSKNLQTPHVASETL